MVLQLKWTRNKRILSLTTRRVPDRSDRLTGHEGDEDWRWVDRKNNELTRPLWKGTNQILIKLTIQGASSPFQGEVNKGGSLSSAWGCTSSTSHGLCKGLHSMCNFSGLEGNAQKKPCCCMAVNNCLELICNYNYDLLKRAKTVLKRTHRNTLFRSLPLPLLSAQFWLCTVSLAIKRIPCLRVKLFMFPKKARKSWRKWNNIINLSWHKHIISSVPIEIPSKPY